MISCDIVKLCTRKVQWFLARQRLMQTLNPMCEWVLAGKQPLQGIHLGDQKIAGSTHRRCKRAASTIIPTSFWDFSDKDSWKDLLVRWKVLRGVSLLQAA